MNVALGIPETRTYVENATRTSETSVGIRIFMPVLFAMIPEFSRFLGWKKTAQLHINQYSSENIISYIHHQDGSKG